MVELHERQAKLHLQTDNTERSVIELHFLFRLGVGGMVAGDDFQRAIDQPFQNRLPIGSRTERRIHLEVGVIDRPGGQRVT